ncbi:hypothetical protein GCM10023083_19990 [Streptomyces phyllanthi]
MIQLNRPVAVGMAEGPERGPALVDELTGQRALKSYAQLPVVHGELSARMGRDDEARSVRFPQRNDLVR